MSSIAGKAGGSPFFLQPVDMLINIPTTNNKVIYFFIGFEIKWFLELY
jgi:hypothetical protein